MIFVLRFLFFWFLPFFFAKGEERKRDGEKTRLRLDAWIRDVLQLLTVVRSATFAFHVLFLAIYIDLFSNFIKNFYLLLHALIASPVLVMEGSFFTLTFLDKVTVQIFLLWGACFVYMVLLHYEGISSYL